MPRLYAVVDHTVFDRPCRDNPAYRTRRQLTIHDEDGVCRRLGVSRAPTVAAHTHDCDGSPVTVTPLPDFDRVLTDGDEARSAIRALPQRVWWSPGMSAPDEFQTPHLTHDIAEAVAEDLAWEYSDETAAVSEHLIVVSDPIPGLVTWVTSRPPRAWFCPHPHPVSVGPNV